jgi:hypothetical protein
VLSSWKDYVEQHLNECAVAGKVAEQDQPPDLVDLRDDEVEIDLSSRDKLEEVLKYLKNRNGL